MSADNWRVCPKCLRDTSKLKEQKRKEAAEAYGKVDSETWKKMCDDAEEIGEEEETNLREDYEIYVSTEGEFSCGYRCRCEKCGFTFSFKKKEQLDLDKEVTE